MIEIIIGQALFFSGAILLALVIRRITPLDLTLSALVSGVAAAVVLGSTGFDTGIRADNIYGFVLYVILPVLVFESAWHLKPGLIKRWLKPILLLSTVGVVIGCLIIATSIYFAINHSGFPFIAALLTAAILAATDPVAVNASLKHLNAPDDLLTLVEGESLFNDASAIVLFSTILSFALLGEVVVNLGHFKEFLMVFFGGAIVGAGLGLIGAIVLLLIANKSDSNIVLLVLAWGSFYVGEHIFHVSGIMCVMMAALTSRLLLKEQEGLLLEQSQATWKWLGTFFTALIFVLMGLVLEIEMFESQWLAIIIAIVSTLIARVIIVKMTGAYSTTTTRPIPKGWQYIQVWGGLRGAIAIVLVLSLPTELPYWWTIQSMVFGVVLFTLLVQATTIKPLIKKYAKEM